MLENNNYINELKYSLILGENVCIHNNSDYSDTVLVKKLFPDCDIVDIYFYINSFFFYDDFLISSFKFSDDYSFNNLFVLKPEWLKRLEVKCKSEPDKLHILFLDGLTKAGFDQQCSVLSIIRSKMIKNIWKFPDNARIVISERGENKQIEPLSESVYHVNIDSNDKIAPIFTNGNVESELSKMKIIHPFLITYAACKDYDFEKYLNKLEIASEALYGSHDAKALIPSLGYEMTKDFTNYCGQQVISLNDIIDEKYSDKDIENMTIEQKYVQIAIFSGIADKYLEKVRYFKNKMGKDMLDLFDAVYSDNYKAVIEISERIRNKKFSSILDEFIKNEYFFQEIEEQNNKNILK